MARLRSDKYNIEEMCNIIDDYTDSTYVPILKEVCYQNHWNYDTVMKYQRENEELMQSIKRLLDKKEADLERGGLTGTLNKTVVVFSLKQLGWKDKQETELTFKDVETFEGLKGLLDKNRECEE